MVTSKELRFVSDIRTESKTDCLNRTAKRKSVSEQYKDHAETKYMNTLVEYTMEFEDFSRCRSMGLGD